MCSAKNSGLTLSGLLSVTPARKHRDMAEKKTSRATIWMSESMELDLRRLADSDGRKFSDFIVHVLSLYAYGHFRKYGEEFAVANRGDSAKSAGRE